MDFLRDVGHNKQVMGEDKCFSYFMQRLSIAVQRGNATSVIGTIALMYLRLLLRPVFAFISFDEVLFHCINSVLLMFY